MRVASPAVVHPLCETGSLNALYDPMEPRLQEVGPVTVADAPAIRQDVQPVVSHDPAVSHDRLRSSEQLSLFGEANEARAPESSVTSWAALALALVVVPWVVIGWIIWMLT
jgi:hypothetical protein